MVEFSCDDVRYISFAGEFSFKSISVASARFFCWKGPEMELLPLIFGMNPDSPTKKRQSGSQNSTLTFQLPGIYLEPGVRGISRKMKGMCPKMPRWFNKKWPFWDGGWKGDHFQRLERWPTSEIKLGSLLETDRFSSTFLVQKRIRLAEFIVTEPSKKEQPIKTSPMIKHHL